MVKMKIRNDKIDFENIQNYELKLVDEVTSYLVDNYWYSSAFKNRKWDGKQRLMTYSKKYGYRIYSGCMNDVIEVFDKNNITYEIEELRNTDMQKVDHKWTGKIMSHGELVDFKTRDYQIEAVMATLAWKRPYGRCMLRMPVRSGKTVTAALLVESLSLRTLFVTTSDLLLNQTVELFKSMFNTKIGIVGAGVWDPSDLTVATIQTLSHKINPPKKIRKEGGKGSRNKTEEELKKDLETSIIVTEWINSFNLVVYDECHHLKSEIWKDIALNCNAFWKIGLSATIFLDKKKPNERENIWLKACTGDIAYSITTKRLIEEGWLVKPTIEIHELDVEDLEGDNWNEDKIYKNGIVIHEIRNHTIAGLTLEKLSKDSRIMIIANEHLQIDIIYEILKLYNCPIEKLTGKIRGQTRKAIVERFKKGETQVLVGNVFGEGVDIPATDIVINAEGGKSKKKLIQRMRNLTPSPGKNHVEVIDFFDKHHKYLYKHAKSRLKAYEAEDAFEIKFFKTHL